MTHNYHSRSMIHWPWPHCISNRKISGQKFAIISPNWFHISFYSIEKLFTILSPRLTFSDFIVSYNLFWAAWFWKSQENHVPRFNVPIFVHLTWLYNSTIINSTNSLEKINNIRKNTRPSIINKLLKYVLSFSFIFSSFDAKRNSWKNSFEFSSEF